MAETNKVKYNIKNVHYAVLHENTSEAGVTTYSYDTPKPIKGAVSIALDPQGDTNTFYADGIAYVTSTTNQGYQGDLTIALIPESFETEVLGAKEQNKVLFEDATVKTVPFALLFQFDGDKTDIKHVLYNCVAARPNIESQTNEETKEVRTETLNLTASPRGDGMVKAKCSDTEATAYNSWFTSVVEYTGA